MRNESPSNNPVEYERRILEGVPAGKGVWA